MKTKRKKPATTPWLIKCPGGAVVADLRREDPDGDDTEFERLMIESFERGYSIPKLEVVMQYATCQMANGDEEFWRDGGLTMPTILRRVVRGEYDHLFN